MEIGYIILAASVTVVGILMVLKPESFCWMSRWKFEEAGDPSPSFLTTIRFGGGVIALVFLVLTVLSCVEIFYGL